MAAADGTGAHAIAILLRELSISVASVAGYTSMINDRGAAASGILSLVI
jgi:hypothetical protein